MSIRLVLCLNAILWNAESIEVKPRLLRFLSCQLKFIRFEGRITVTHCKPESCSVIVLKTIWPCCWRLVRHCVNCDTILFYCVFIYLTLQKFNDDRTRGICCKKLPFYLNKSSKVPSWTSCWYEWHCFLQVPSLARKPFLNISKQIVLPFNWTGSWCSWRNLIMTQVGHCEHKVALPNKWSKQMQHLFATAWANQQNTRVANILGVKNPRETACQWKDATKSFAFRCWWKLIGKVGNVLQCR